MRRFTEIVALILNSLEERGYIVRGADGTYSLANVTGGLTPGTFTNTTIVVDASGIITSITSGSGGGGSTVIPQNTFTPPVDADYSWVNQNGATVDTAQTPGGIYLEQVTNNIATDNLFGRLKAIPAAPYTVMIAFQANYTPPTTGNADDVIRGGIVLRDSGNGKMVSFDINEWTGSADVRLQIIAWNSATSVNGNVKSQIYGVSVPIMWLAIQDDNAGNRNYLISSNGYKWNKWYTEASNNFITPDQIGFFLAAGTGTAGYAYGMWLLSWQETSP